MQAGVRRGVPRLEALHSSFERHKTRRHLVVRDGFEGQMRSECIKMKARAARTKINQEEGLDGMQSVVVARYGFGSTRIQKLS